MNRNDIPPMPEVSCDLCGGTERVVLNSACHFMAPLKAEVEGDTLILRCYIPDCQREVARFKIVREELIDTKAKTHCCGCDMPRAECVCNVQ